MHLPRTVLGLLCSFLAACGPALSNPTDAGVDGGGGGGGSTGPYAGPTTAAWTKCTRTDNGFISSSATFVNHKTLTFLGSGESSGAGGLLVTADDGATWQPVTLPAIDPTTTLTGHPIYGLASDGARLYVADAAVRGTLVSDDDGATWTAVASPFGMNATGFRVKLFFLEGQLWAGGSNGGIASSSDKGVTWTTLSPNTGNPANVTNTIEAIAGQVFAGQGSNLYLLPSFQKASAGIPFPNGSNQLLSLGTKLLSISTDSSVGSPGKLYVADPAVTPLAWTQRSTLGSIWRIVRVQSALFAASGSPGSIKPQLSTDEGATWSAFDQGLGTTVLSGTIGAGAKYLFVVTNGDVYRTPLQ